MSEYLYPHKGAFFEAPFFVNTRIKTRKDKVRTVLSNDTAAVTGRLLPAASAACVTTGSPEGPPRT